MHARHPESRVVTRGGQSTDHDGQTQQVCSPERRAQALTALTCAAGQREGAAAPYAGGRARGWHSHRQGEAAGDGYYEPSAHLEHLSLEIQEAQQSSEAVPVVAAEPTRAADSGRDETELAIAC